MLNSYHNLVGKAYNPYVLNHLISKDWEFNVNRLTVLQSLSYAEEEVLEQQKNLQISNNLVQSNDNKKKRGPSFFGKMLKKINRELKFSN